MYELAAERRGEERERRGEGEERRGEERRGKERRGGKRALQISLMMYDVHKCKHVNNLNHFITTYIVF